MKVYECSYTAGNGKKFEMIESRGDQPSTRAIILSARERLLLTVFAAMAGRQGIDTVLRRVIAVGFITSGEAAEALLEPERHDPTPAPELDPASVTPDGALIVHGGNTRRTRSRTKRRGGRR